MSPRMVIAAIVTLAGAGAIAFPGATAETTRVGPGVCGLGGARLWARHDIPAATTIAGHRVGGLSGIDRDPRDGSFIVISDDRGRNGGARLFRLALDIDQGRALAVRVLGVTALRQADGRPFASEDRPGPGVDAEAVRVGKRGEIFWASEGAGAKRQGPALYRQRGWDTPARALALPSLLMRDPAGSSGPRDNRSFEALDLDPARGALWLGLEAPLVEAGDVPSTSAGADTLLIALSKSRSVVKRLAYPLEPISRQRAGKRADNGLAELLALSGKRFLVLERSGSEQEDGSFTYVTRLYCAWLPRGGGAQRQPSRLVKTLVVELNRLGSFETANFEGMSWGPRLPDGGRSLVLVADNDFQGRPSTIAVLAF